MQKARGTAADSGSRAYHRCIRVRRPARIAALLLGFCAAAAVAFALAGGDRADRLGLATHLRWSGEPIAPQLATIRDAGVGWIREDFTWGELEPQRGRFDWRSTDALMAAAAAHEVDVLAILAYSAPWAADGPDARHPPRDPAAYARYARAVVERYGSGGAFWRGRRHVRPLRAVEVWNEPWGHFFWARDPDPARYAALARAAAKAVRAAAPDVEVLVPADLLQVRTDGAIVPWFASLLRADPGLPALVDGWTVHPYPSPRSAPPGDPAADPRFAFRRVELVRDVAARHDAERPIWITELGWSTAPAAPEGVSEEEQARHLGAALDRALGPWSGFVERVFVYCFTRSRSDPADLEGHFGLRRADGSFKPAWDALRDRAR